uniref:Phage tail fiber protein n=1 Tax=Escherichia coli TaxID=562 RepID=A0A160HRM4_ECOLX|nr:phage tail fiber protein [Escherichia coli]
MEIISPAAVNPPVNDPPDSGKAPTSAAVGLFLVLYALRHPGE